jgi:hypothetical protein
LEVTEIDKVCAIYQAGLGEEIDLSNLPHASESLSLLFLHKHYAIFKQNIFQKPKRMQTIELK